MAPHTFSSRDVCTHTHTHIVTHLVTHIVTHIVTHLVTHLKYTPATILSELGNAWEERLTHSRVDRLNDMS